MDHLKFALLIFILIGYSSKTHANEEQEEATLQRGRLSNLNQKSNNAVYILYYMMNIEFTQ